MNRIDVIRDRAVNALKVRELKTVASDMTFLLERIDKLENAARDCQQLFQNIRDYGAMASPSDYVKVQYVWARLNAALDNEDDEKETTHG